MNMHIVWTIIASMLGVTGIVGSLALGVQVFSRPKKGNDPKRIDTSNPQDLTPEELLAILHRESEARGKRRKVVNRVVFGYLGIALILLLAMLLLSALTGQWKLLDNYLSTVLSFASIFSLFAFYTANKNEKKAALLAAELDDVRFVGPLLEAMHFQDTKLKNIATDRLTTLLPRLKASDRHLLDDDQRLCLYKSLATGMTPKPNPAYVNSALQAIAQVGDKRGIQWVEPFCSSGPRQLLGEYTHELASHCLATLQERLEVERKNNMLLRPAVTSADPEVLLKPVGAPQEAEAMQLLRASTQD